MPENNKIQEFFQKLAPCIKRGDLDACVEGAAQLAGEIGVGAGKLLKLSMETCLYSRYDFAYVIALVAAQGLEGEAKAEAYSNAGIAAYYLKKVEKAEQHYKKAIEVDPNYAAVHSNYANLLSEQKKNDEAEQYYKQAIEVDPNYAAAHSNYALLLSEQKRNDEAEQHYKQAIEVDPKLAAAHSNYALLLSEQKRNDEAEKHYKQAIEADPNLIEAHGAYGLFLIESDQRENSWKETKIASDLLQKALRFTESYLAKAWFYEKYSKKYLGQNEFYESSEDAYSAGQEYLKAADTTDDGSKEKSAFELRGNELIAKSYIRKDHKNLQELINNLKLASEYYKKASVCQVGGREEVCAACRKVINVFSEVLNSLDDIIKDKVPMINKNQWKDDLEKSQFVYEKK